MLYKTAVVIFGLLILQATAVELDESAQVADAGKGSKRKTILIQSYIKARAKRHFFQNWVCSLLSPSKISTARVRIMNAMAPVLLLRNVATKVAKNQAIVLQGK